jgi:hypothetical protein
VTRFPFATAVLALACVCVAATLGVSAQDRGSTVTPLPPRTTIATAVPHPIVGSWSETRNGGAHVTFFADGNVILTDGDRQTWHGAWQPTDAGGPIATYVVQSWGRGGGQGIEDFARSVSGDELTLGYGTFRRLVPPDPANFARSTTTSTED